MDNKHIQQINRLGYLSLDITCCSKLAGFSRTTLSGNYSFLATANVRGQKQFPRQIEATISSATFGIGLELACIGS